MALGEDTNPVGWWAAMASTKTYTKTWTRQDAVLRQFEVFLTLAGAAPATVEEIVSMIRRRLVCAVGAYLLDKNGQRFVEVEVQLDYGVHDQLVSLGVGVRRDLPGWEGDAAPEIKVVAKRFGEYAKDLGLRTRTWVRWASEVATDAARLADARKEFGYAGPVAPWAGTPVEGNDSVLELDELRIVNRFVADTEV